jgi:hypothetical protein
MSDIVSGLPRLCLIAGDMELTVWDGGAVFCQIVPNAPAAVRGGAFDLDRERRA